MRFANKLLYLGGGCCCASSIGVETVTSVNATAAAATPDQPNGNIVKVKSDQTAASTAAASTAAASTAPAPAPAPATYIAPPRARDSPKKVDLKNNKPSTLNQTTTSTQADPSSVAAAHAASGDKNKSSGHLIMRPQQQCQTTSTNATRRRSLRTRLVGAKHSVLIGIKSARRGSAALITTASTAIDLVKMTTLISSSSSNRRCKYVNVYKQFFAKQQEERAQVSK
jgi:hypothetical protein